MLFGYTLAAIGGILFTAVRNWTPRARHISRLRCCPACSGPALAHYLSPLAGQSSRARGATDDV